MKQSYSDRLVGGLSTVFVAIFAVMCLLPFIMVVMTSITEEQSLWQHGYSIFPKKFSLEGYKIIFQTDKVWKAYQVTIFVTLIGTVLSMIVTASMSYALSVKQLKYRNHLSFFAYFTMLFTGGMVPTYIIVTQYFNLKNSIWALILPAVLNPWNMFLLRNFFSSIPESLAESAKIDGANDILILFRIILPVSLPALASVGLFYALAYWNDWFRAMLYLTNRELFPLQYLLMDILNNLQFMNELASKSGINLQGYSAPTQTARMATAVVTIGPIVALYPFLQKYFAKGLIVGAVKG